jgi:hypothetical protein
MTNTTEAFRCWLEGVRDEQITVALRREKCPGCNGKGTTVFGWPASDAAVFTGDDFDQDPDLGENLAAGLYDQPCPECDGNQIVTVLDEDLTDPDVVADWYEYLASVRESNDIERQERMMGA